MKLKAIQNRQQGKTSDYDVEKIPTAIEYKVAKEIIK